MIVVLRKNVLGGNFEFKIFARQKYFIFCGRILEFSHDRPTIFDENSRISRKY